MADYYIDASIWRDFHENRVDRFRLLGEWAFELFKKIRKNKEKVLYSDLIVEELSKDFGKETIIKIFSIMMEEGLLKKVEIKEKQIKEAVRLRNNLKIPFGDVLHAILARDNNAIMVTRDRHFEEVQNIVNIKKPEELI